ncbi:DNA polymerase III subunit beta [Roseivirga seohaensis]|uniref:Polymerase beta nucleotidyltransferase domain-containing protein n=2 Tax=Roseivirga seohaensis TaxID=1914963 RepID=A0A0L8AMS0_9BACT|nr:nucleotidyltransferase domain-containing protein [Roseivirga seohaensis]KOF03517.1 hypothetical protein OB69_06450 [Roseivirga seohaensis subsp. aquiponti]KYG85046.1 DNA polymerase III subunit beta [Roseivirga seohaensis]
MVSIIENNLDAIYALFKEHKVISAALFGSAAKNNLHGNSDIDFLIQFSEELELLDYADNYFDLKEKLETLLGRSVDLVSRKSLKNPILIQSINDSKKELYAA